MKAAVINAYTQQVVNVIELEPNSPWVPPMGHMVIFSESAAIGMVCNGQSFYHPAMEGPDAEV